MISSEDLCEKGRENQTSEGWKFQENRADFGNKLVMHGPAKNSDFWWVDSSVCYRDLESP